MKALIILVSVLLIGHKGIAQDWVYIGSDRKGSKWYIKSSYVTKNYNSIKIWSKQVNKSSTITKNGKKITLNNTYTVDLYEYNCSEQTSKLIGSTTYNSQGRVIKTFKVEEYNQEWDDVVPDSMGELILNKVCELFN